MNWKQEAVDKLKGYQVRKRALENIPEEIQRLKSQSISIKSAVKEGTPVQGGGSREDMMLSNLVQREELKRSLEQAKAWVQSVDRGLSILDEEQRLVLERLYLKHAMGNVDLLCEELSIEKATVYRRRDSALRQFTLALYGAVES